MSHDRFNIVVESDVLKEVKVLVSPFDKSSDPLLREDFSEYVAHLQLHMALQARNLVPTLTKTADSREQLLHQTQANFEKFVSRQVG
ncbi:MAG: hypothetical protein SFY66_08635 [Oculatellaceae cyanobacterium bins.114]|nr:hypothetical protein [Oculatellaceae cyanobacterium bins.114]